MFLRNSFLHRLILIIGIVVVLTLHLINFSPGQILETNSIIWENVQDVEILPLGNTHYLTGKIMHMNQLTTNVKSQDGICSRSTGQERPYSIFKVDAVPENPGARGSKIIGLGLPHGIYILSIEDLESIKMQRIKKK